MVVSKVSDHIQIQIKMSNPSREPTAYDKIPNEDLKDMDVLCAFKIKIKSQNLDHRYIKDHQPYMNQDQDAKPQSGTSSILQSCILKMGLSEAKVILEVISTTAKLY